MFRKSAVRIYPWTVIERYDTNCWYV